MTRVKNKWVGPIVEEAIERASCGVWECELPTSETTANVKIVKSEAFGPYLVVAGSQYCQKTFRWLADVGPKMSSGVLILIEHPEDPVPALEHTELRTIVDEADEVIVAGSAGCVVWDRLSNRRFRAVDEELLLDETLTSMRRLDLLFLDGAMH